MAVAFLSARRSKDPNKQVHCGQAALQLVAAPRYVSGRCASLQVGACIVSPDKIILGIGYNGFPRGCPDDKVGLRCSPGLCSLHKGHLCPAVALTNLCLLGSCPGRGKHTLATRWTPSAESCSQSSHGVMGC